MTGYTTRTANAGDKQAIYDVLSTSFFEDMPLFRACDMPKPPPIEEWPALQQWKNGLTIVAESDDGKIVGVAINVVPQKDGELIAAAGKIEKFFDIVNEASKGLLYHMEETIMELRIMSVSKEHRCKGIAKRLITETENLAKSKGHEKVFAISTGSFMEAAFRKVNWEPIFSYLYKDHAKMDPNFKIPPLPHDTLTLFEKKL